MAKILVVDDDEDLRLLLTRILEHRGYQVILGRDGEEALALAVSDRPDAIILDLQLPKVDGREVCRRLKADPETKSIPIVMLTAAYTLPTDAESGIALGADEYVIKPFVREVLLHNVTRLLGEDAT